MSVELGSTGGEYMAGLSADRPSEVVLAARGARQFYLEGVSKVDIADRLGISRFRVARLPDSPRGAGTARSESGPPWGTPAPGPCAAPSSAIRRQGDIAGAFALLPAVTIAVVAIGAWAPGLSTIYDAVTPGERDALVTLGVRAELAGVFLGADGRPVPTPLDSRMIVTPGPMLERIPFVLSVAYGVAKSPAVCAAIRGRLVHGLVTHASLARAMLGAA